MFSNTMNAQRHADECTHTHIYRCDEYLRDFEPFRDMVIVNEQLDADDLKAGAEAGEVTLGDFEEKLKVFKYVIIVHLCVCMCTYKHVCGC